MVINNSSPLLIESAWEVCNQVGGIYTVIRSKVPSIVQAWGERFALIGPYFSQHANVEFEPSEDYNNPFGKAVLKMRKAGFEVHYGHWLVTGRPKVILFPTELSELRMRALRNELLKNHQISVSESNTLVNSVLAFASLTTEFFKNLADGESTNQPIIGQFHEWMASMPIMEIKRLELANVKTVFTTHATQLGRYLAGNDPDFYQKLPYYDWLREAHFFGIESVALVERVSALSCDVFTTVSDITGKECEYFLGRKPDIITPNGLNINRFVALHEFQNLHKEFKEKINQFVIGHFFHAYKFDLENTVYFFTSGRYEYRNKGFDITLEALNRLNKMMKRYNVQKTVVTFFVTKKPFHSINPVVLQSRALLEEIRQTCSSIQRQLGERLFMEVTAGTNAKLPPMNELVDEYWKLRLRRNVTSWKTQKLPIVVTHLLENDADDEILDYVRENELYNAPDDRVKIVYHPDFISSASPLFGMDYGQFVRGCNLGVFPSYYEPWGYTPLECLASGVPSVTSDLAGFGDYVMKNIANYQQKGMYVVRRLNRSFDEAANELADQMYAFVQQSLRERIQQRNQSESTADEFDWKNLVRFYEAAYRMALKE